MQLCLTRQAVGLTGVELGSRVDEQVSPQRERRNSIPEQVAVACGGAGKEEGWEADVLVRRDQRVNDTHGIGGDSTQAKVVYVVCWALFDMVFLPVSTVIHLTD